MRIDDVENYINGQKFKFTYKLTQSPEAASIDVLVLDAIYNQGYLIYAPIDSFKVSYLDVVMLGKIEAVIQKVLEMERKHNSPLHRIL